MRLSSSRATALAHRPQQDFPLWDKAGTRPSLDLQFADRKDLVDATTGSNLVDFTRASSGTYVGSDGLIKTATTNLVLESEDFSTTWTATSLTFDTNSVVAPDGKTTADKIIETIDPGVHQIGQGTVTIGVSYVFSLYAKAGERDRLRLSGFGVEGQGFLTDYNLSAGTVTSAPSGSSITPVGNGWYRCSLVVTATGTAGPIIRLGDQNGSFSYTGDGTSGIYLWGAQLEQSTTVGEYVKTTSTINSAPRFDHDPTTGESLGLLVEESRTNVVTGSNDFYTTGWSDVGTNPLLSADASVLNPEAVAGALIAGQAGGRRFAKVNGVTTNTYCASLFVRREDGATNEFSPSLRIDFGFTGDALGVEVQYDWIADELQIRSGTPISYGSLKYPNGWVRIWLTQTDNGTGDATRTLQCSFYTNAVTSGTGSSSRGGYIFGAQLEAGSFPTSYIPTTSSTVTRAADVASISGSNFSSWFTSPAENTFYAEYGKPPSTGQIMEGADGGNIVGLSFSLGTVSPRVTARQGPSRLDSGNNNLPAYLSGTNKIAASTSASGSAAGSNGTLFTGGTPTQADWTATSYLSIGYRGAYNTERCNTTIRRLTYWPTRLGNEALQTITQ